MANSSSRFTPTMSEDSSEQKGQNITESNASIIQCPLSQQHRSSLDGPVSILWDIENCPVPSDVRPEDVAGNIRMALQVHPVIKGVVMMFSAYGDFNAFPRRLREGCQRTGVKLIDVPNGRKDAADKAILVDMFLFALDNPPPSSIMLISGDVDFAPALHILGQRGYTVILVIPAGVGVSSALCNAGKFVWDWPVVARGEGFVPPSKLLVQPRGSSVELAGYLMGCHINDSADGQNEEEAIVYRGMSQSYYNSREFSLVSQSLSEYNPPHMSYLPTSTRSYSLPSGLNDVAGGPMPSSDNTECQVWVQPGDLNGLKGQLIRLLELSGGSLPLVRVPAEYQKLYSKPLFISEYGAFKLIDLFKKMDDAISVEGKGARRFVSLRNKKGGTSAPPLSLAKRDKKGKGTLEETTTNAVIGGCSSDELSDEERVVVEEHDGRNFTGKRNKGRAARCQIDGRVLEHFKCELQEILVSYSCRILLSCFEAVYKQRYKKQLEYQQFGVDKLEDLLEKVSDVVVLHEEPVSKRKFLSAVGG
ncbi:uncharacterized protein LOC127101199 [Lathyrus oleraceus]|uniref:HTH OST-type domain-containing protein n=1 Tax=Pisum sativum TaxID=3888 RepID=A0A9D4VPF4_PEA|nr:uncharacterized protein LOC127101199 [Pisum sativum]XP_050894501.1 uncharacterized protein LOC127101199 [Pisum sativum]KAI5386988.1 hypothetical protein KIW84_073220 [Pisum sativum]